MICKEKAMGFALAVTLAVAALVAPGASAAELHSTEAHTIISGGQTTTHSFTAGSGFGAITCNSVNYEGTTTATTQTTWTILPSTSGCKDTFARTVDVIINGCDYEFHATSGGPPNWTGHYYLKCPLGKKVEYRVTSGGTTVCTITFGEQSGVGPIDFANVANGDIEVKFTVNNLKNTTSGGSLNCGIANGEHTSGTYSGTTIFAGINTAGAGVNLTIG